MCISIYGIPWQLLTSFATPGLPKPRKEDELAEATTTVRNHKHSVMDPPGSYKAGSGLEDVRRYFTDVFGNNFRFRFVSY